MQCLMHRVRVEDEQPGVAVGRALRHVVGADDARGSAAIFDDELLLQRVGSLPAKSRASGSTDPPGGYGTTNLTSLAGHSCADAFPVKTRKTINHPKARITASAK